jgi:hypothetical protein
MLLNKEFISAEAHYFEKTKQLRVENEKLSADIKASKNPSSFYYRNKFNNIDNKERDNRVGHELQRKRSYSI